MPEPEWTDTSSYSRDDDRRVPYAWTLEVAPGVEVVVHHYLGCGDTWFVSCHAVRIEQRQLKNTTIESAKSEALSVVHARLATWMAAMGAVDPSKAK